MDKTLRTLSDKSQQNIWAGKTVMIRADFNVPIRTEAKETKGAKAKSIILDDSRIEAAVPSIELLLKQNCKIVIISHLGRPTSQPVSDFLEEKSQEIDKKYSLQIVADRLAELLGKEVKFCPTPVGRLKDAMVSELEAGSVLLLENIRSVSEEKRKSVTPEHAVFAKELSKNIDVYVNEAFSVCHRKDTSLVGIPKSIPHFAGLGLEKEVDIWSSMMDQPKKPFVMIIGGAKISDKVGAVQHLAEKADAVLVGGGTANNFLKAEGFEIYESYLEEKDVADGKSLKTSGSASSAKVSKSPRKVNYVKVAEHLLEVNRAEKIVIDGFIPLPKIIMPLDVIAAKSTTSSESETEVVELTSSQVITSKDDVMYLDIGPKTAALFAEIISQAGTVFWNGPLGVFEKEPFSNGTKVVAKAIAKSKAYSIIGGGDTIAAAHALKLSEQFNYVSVAGGAALEFLSGKTLPGIAPLLSNT